MDIVLTFQDRLLPVRDQGYRPTCLAFAASEIHSLAQDLNQWLSPEYLYQRANERSGEKTYFNGLTFENTVSSIREDGQPLELHCTYQAVECHEVQAVPNSSTIMTYSMQKSAMTPTEIYEAALTGTLFVLGIELTHQFQTVITAPFVIDLEDAPPEDGHAVVLSALGKTPAGEKLFRIKNSWGVGWADQGHVWLTEKFLEKYLIVAMRAA
jgi:C1A family cysteine protease